MSQRPLLCKLTLFTILQFVVTVDIHSSLAKDKKVFSK